MRRPQRPVLGHRYRLIRQIDAGGMGSVWLAEAVHLRSLVAVKIMDRAIAETPEAAQRFLHEARTAASLRSPHVVQILDYGVHESTPFIAMELLEGESLAARLKREGRLASWEQTELVLRHVARALGRAHDAGVIHRDLKPGNIFLVRDEEEEIVKLLDFGIAKTTLSPLGAPLPSDTRTGEFLGSPAYASPEQLQASKAIDHRADIWSLGVIAYQCLLGRAPFAEDSFVALLLSICTGPLPTPSEQGPVPAGFDAWFARACARDVEQRFQSVREAAAELRHLVGAARGSPAALAASTSQPAAARASSPPQPYALISEGAASEGAASEGAAFEGVASEGAPFEGVAPAPPPDGGLAALAPPSLTAPLPLALSPSPPDWPPVQPPTSRTDTLPLVPPAAGSEPRRKATALTLLLALPAIAWLVFFTLDASSSRAVIDRSRAALSAGAPSAGAPSAGASAPERDETPERAPEAPGSGAPARGSDAPPPAPPPHDDPPPGLDSAASDDPAPAVVAAQGPAPGLGSAPGPSDLPERNPSPALEAVVPDSGARAPEPAAASRPSALARTPSPSRMARSDTARLTVTASAPSMVLLDGVPFGSTPLESIRVEPGNHEVVFIQNGRRSAETLVIRSGEHKRVEARFEPPPGDGLNEAAVKRTIKAHRSAVVDTCWEHAFDARASGDSTTVRVPVTISVEPSGVVRSVVTAAEPPGYPALRRCVEDRVAAWRFPGARAETVVNVAFVFALN